MALLISAIAAGQFALDSLRVSEADAVKRSQFTVQPVEARLWEDPFAALTRYRESVCRRDAQPPEARPPESRPPESRSSTSAPPSCAGLEVDSPALREILARDAGSLTVIAALLPGSRFVGAEEARRRIRYAVLTGLRVEGYFPDDSQHMGLLRASFCSSFLACGTGPMASEKDEVDVPFELFVAQPRGIRDERPDRIAVLWIDDARAGDRWLSTLAILLDRVSPPRGSVQLRIIGPYTSDRLADALGKDLPRIREEVRQLAGEPYDALARSWDLALQWPETGFIAHWNALAKVQLISPFSTASADQVNQSARSTAGQGAPPGQHCRDDDRKPGDEGGDCIDRLFRSWFEERRGELVALYPPAEPVAGRFFVRTISSDARLVDLLLRELCARGLGDGRGGRVVLLPEWDSLYARTFARTLGERLASGEEGAPCGRNPAGGRVGLKIYSYLRGLDGATVEGAAKRERLLPRSGKKEGDKNAATDIEWPESRDQRDYVRRLVGQIQRDAGGETIRAIGIIGMDVYDKLILAQAMRTAFADRLLFTTDLDARLLHPDASRAARNLVVASSLSLVPESPSDQGVAPFRDIYQTAAFIGTRFAASQQPLLIERERKDLLFEIGNDGEVELGTNGVPGEEGDRRRQSAIVNLVVLGLLAVLILLHPAPAMKAAISRTAKPVPFDVVAVSGLTVMAWAFAVGVALDLGWPERVGFHRIAIISVTAALVFCALVGAGTLSARVGVARAGVVRAAAVLLVVGLAVPLWLACPPPGGGMREPFAPLSGVSAWPAQLLRTLAVVLFAWFLDFTWNGSRQAAIGIGDSYFAIPPPSPPRPWPNPWRVLRDAVASAAAFCLRRWRRPSALSLARRIRWALQAVLWRMWVRGAAALPPMLQAVSTWLWPRNFTVEDGAIDGRSVWEGYLRLQRNWPRFIRLVIWVLAVVILLTIGTMLVGAAWPEIPARGLDDRRLFWATIMAAVYGTITLLILVGDRTVLTWSFIRILKKGRTIYPDQTVASFARFLRPPPPQGSHDVWTEQIHARAEARGTAARPQNSLLDDWIDVRLLAGYTAKVGPQIMFPFILLALLIIARSNLFDNWAPGGPVLFALVFYLLLAIAMVSLLNVGAEVARRDAIRGMEEDLRWMQGADPRFREAADQFKGLIDEVRTLREGAFAPFYEQPLLRAILVPLGGAGTVQLIESFLFRY